MLKEWQKRFPNAFKQHANLLLFPAEEQASLCLLLERLEKHAPEIFNENAIQSILSNINRAMIHSQQLKRLHTLLAEENLHAITQEVLQLLTAIPNLEVKPAGLSDAIELFNLSNLQYNADNAGKFSSLTNVLALRLSRSIFDARQRCFSDYAESREPLDQKSASRIINTVHAAKNTEAGIKAFFDFFAAYRPFPPSQDYIVELDIPELIEFALEELKQTETGLRSLDPNDPKVFDAIKHDVVNSIICEDLCSTANYDDLMLMIKAAAKEMLQSKDKGIEHSNMKNCKQTMFTPAAEKTDTTPLLPRANKM